jgi:hypothetical protein
VEADNVERLFRTLPGRTTQERSTCGTYEFSPRTRRRWQVTVELIRAGGANMHHTHKAFDSSNPLRQLFTVAALVFAVGVAWVANLVMGPLQLPASLRVLATLQLLGRLQGTHPVKALSM